MPKTQNWIKNMNELGMRRIPFFFMIDFDLNNHKIFPLDEIPSNIAFQTSLFSTNRNIKDFKLPLEFEKYPISKKDFENGFNIVMGHLKYGNSFLTNYTASTLLKTNYNLEQIYQVAEAKYKLLVDNEFVCFSPETFVTISNGVIASYPRKGTIDSSIKDAKQVILNDPKETAEHYTIVDLIRNDLSRVATKVKVPRFRYIDTITSNQKTLFQVSSKVEGELPSDYLNNLGTIFSNLLPAGSISGAPKIKTIEIIKEAEISPRGMYTGIFGIFDGASIDSAVAIRFIEKSNDELFYKSGGGVTFQSKCDLEYQEMIDKVYVPISRKYKDL